MTKADLIEEVASISNLSKKNSELVISTFFQSVVDALIEGDKVELRGFGTFKLRQRKPRLGRNPKTGERVNVAAKLVPFFKPGKQLRELVNFKG